MQFNGFILSRPVSIAQVSEFWYIKFHLHLFRFQINIGKGRSGVGMFFDITPGALLLTWINFDPRIMRMVQGRTYRARDLLKIISNMIFLLQYSIGGLRQIILIKMLFEIYRIWNILIYCNSRICNLSPPQLFPGEDCYTTPTPIPTPPTFYHLNLHPPCGKWSHAQ